jgi:hypothetical protein
MGGTKPLTPYERVLLQLTVTVYLVLLPVALLVAIMYILGWVLSTIIRQEDVLKTLKAAGQLIFGVFKTPFVITYLNYTGQTGYVCLSSRTIQEWHRQVLDDDWPDTSPSDLPTGSRPSRGPAIGDTYQTQYRPYRLRNSDEFRLLIISPASFDEALRGELIISSFSSPPPPEYDALSYTWADETGNAAKSQELFLEGGKWIIFITKKCDAAIRRLRHTQEKRRVWIDAICID